jgi:hypothetical protein
VAGCCEHGNEPSCLIKKKRGVSSLTEKLSDSVVVFPKFRRRPVGLSWMLLHRNRVCIGCDGCLKQTRCTRFQAL